MVVLTADAMVGGVHFFPDDPADAVARKALRVNLSDLAAKGAKPAGFLLTLALPKGFGDDWLTAFARGLGGDARTYGCPLLGGDTVYTPGPVTISITAFGTVPERHHGAARRRARRRPRRRHRHDRRRGAGSEAAQGARRCQTLEARRSDAAPSSDALSRSRSRATRWPRPCVSTPPPRWTSPTGSPAISASSAAPRASAPMIEVARVPLSGAARAAVAAEPKLIETILTGGDDFEVVCTVPPRKLASFRVAAARARRASDRDRPRGCGQGGPVPRLGWRPLRFARPSFSHF